MSELKAKPGEVIAFNKNGTSIFSQIAWSRMKVLPDGSRLGGWREVIPGMDVQAMIKQSNVPEALKASKPLVPPSPISWSKEEKSAMIEDEVGKRVGVELDKFGAAYKAQTGILDKLSNHIMEHYSDMINPAGDLADTVIGVLDANKAKLKESVSQLDEISNIRKHLDENGVQLPEGQSFSESLILLLKSYANVPSAPETEKKTSGTKKA